MPLALNLCLGQNRAGGSKASSPGTQSLPSMALEPPSRLYYCIHSSYTSLLEVLLLRVLPRSLIIPQNNLKKKIFFKQEFLSLRTKVGCRELGW